MSIDSEVIYTFFLFNIVYKLKLRFTRLIINVICGRVFKQLAFHQKQIVLLLGIGCSHQ